MKKINKDNLVSYGVYVVGLCLVIKSCMRVGANNVLDTIKDHNLKLTDAEGNLMDISLPSRNPFKK